MGSLYGSSTSSRHGHSPRRSSGQSITFTSSRKPGRDDISVHFSPGPGVSSTHMPKCAFPTPSDPLGALPIETFEEVVRFAYAAVEQQAEDEGGDPRGWKRALMKQFCLVCKSWREVALRVLLEEDTIEYDDESASRYQWFEAGEEGARFVRKLALDFTRRFAKGEGKDPRAVLGRMERFALLLRACSKITTMTVSTSMLDVRARLPTALWDALIQPPHLHLRELVLGGPMAPAVWEGLICASAHLPSLRIIRLSIDTRPDPISLPHPMPQPAFRLRELYIDVASCVAIDVWSALLETSAYYGSLNKLVVNFNGYTMLESARPVVRWLAEQFGDSLLHLELEDTSMSEGERGVGLQPTHSLLLDVPLAPCPNLHTLILAGVRHNAPVVSGLACSKLKELWIGDHYSGTADYLLESLLLLPELTKLWICDDWETPEHAGVSCWPREGRRAIVSFCRERRIELLLNLDWDEDVGDLDAVDAMDAMDTADDFYY